LDRPKREAAAIDIIESFEGQDPEHRHPDEVIGGSADAKKNDTVIDAKHVAE
jgi:hypothetical protein